MTNKVQNVNHTLVRYIVSLQIVVIQESPDNIVWNVHHTMTCYILVYVWLQRKYTNVTLQVRAMPFYTWLACLETDNP